MGQAGVTPALTRNRDAAGRPPARARPWHSRKTRVRSAPLSVCRGMRTGVARRHGASAPHARTVSDREEETVSAMSPVRTGATPLRVVLSLLLAGVFAAL